MSAASLAELQSNIAALAEALLTLAETFAAGVQPPLELPNQSPLDQFISERVYDSPGNAVTLGEFYSSFEVWCDTKGIFAPSKTAVGRAIPFPRGVGNSNRVMIGNISLDGTRAVVDPTPLVAINGRLRRARGAAR